MTTKQQKPGGGLAAGRVWETALTDELAGGEEVCGEELGDDCPAHLPLVHTLAAEQLDVGSQENRETGAVIIWLNEMYFPWKSHKNKLAEKKKLCLCFLESFKSCYRNFQEYNAYREEMLDSSSFKQIFQSNDINQKSAKIDKNVWES